MASEPNRKGLQIFLSILSIAGLGVAAYTPLYNQIVNVETRLAAHISERGHPGFWRKTRARAFASRKWRPSSARRRRLPISNSVN